MIVIAFVFFLSFLFSYNAWKGLRAEIDGNKATFGFLWLAPLFFLICSRMAWVFIYWNVWDLRLLDIVGFWRRPGFELHVGYISLILFCIYFAKKNMPKIMYFLEDVRWAVALFMLGWLLYDLLYSRALVLQTFWPIISLALAMILDLVLAKRYRKFRWYKSGKKGFMFLAGNTIFFLGMSLAVPWYGICALFFLVCLFILGGTFSV